MTNLRSGPEDPESVAPQEGRPALAKLSADFAAAGGTMYLCPVCVRSRDLDEGSLQANASVLGSAALWEWVGEEATVLIH